ncbi:hypothetical protein EVAR_36236_1 [Eumeta japonica]|uniref:Uncharacterized protein n=1 Tax=Eumeta variegata TaxID=151549 RepID=A0A4C1WX93_EUMVA|nr:hypothetical protein EVAR_36236_1 [Eumeta japonica]
MSGLTRDLLERDQSLRSVSTTPLTSKATLIRSRSEQWRVCTSSHDLFGVALRRVRHVMREPAVIEDAPRRCSKRRLASNFHTSGEWLKELRVSVRVCSRAHVYARVRMSLCRKRPILPSTGWGGSFDTSCLLITGGIVKWTCPALVDESDMLLCMPSLVCDAPASSQSKIVHIEDPFIVGIFI